MHHLRITGARQHNLRLDELEIPHDKLTAITGVSGSGKSSLAFDTIFAEGQWRFLESLPAYARMLMEKGARPEVESIRNVRPAIALEQHNSVRAARSTVGTLTESYDLVRLLFATEGTMLCPKCSIEMRSWSPSSAAKKIVESFGATSATLEVALPKVVDRLNGEADWAAKLLAAGYARVRLGGEISKLDDTTPSPLPDEGATVVLERVTLPPKNSERFNRAVEEAFRVGSGGFMARDSAGRELRFSAEPVCDSCGATSPRLRPVLFSYNHPLGACPVCTGFGAELLWDEKKVVPDPELTLAQGAIEPWQKPSNKWWQEELVAHAKGEGVPLDIPWGELGDEDRAKVWTGTPSFEGVEEFFGYLETKRYKMHVRVFMARYRSPSTCSLCKGARLKPEVAAITVGGLTISTINELPISELPGVMASLREKIGEAGLEILWRLEARISTLNELGLGYLTMSRPSRTLSGGEMQRAALTRQLSNRLTGALYVLDEPSVGLHPADAALISRAMRELTDNGNTVIFVEHDTDLIEKADHIVELGPGGGANGGRVVYQGDFQGLLKADTATSRFLADRAGLADNDMGKVRSFSSTLLFKGIRQHNISGLDAEIPLNALTVITGVSGSGKSTLMGGVILPVVQSHGLYGPVTGYEITGDDDAISTIGDVRLVDQTPLGRTPRSIPLTYLNAFTPIRKIFSELESSRRLGLMPKHFSFNTRGGRCDVCDGSGQEKLEMLFFEDIYVPCRDCNGHRFKPEVLAVHYKGNSIHDILESTVDELLELFKGVKAIERPLGLMAEVGLGYLVCGQGANTLSGGEAQRLKICGELPAGKGGRKKPGVLYLLDEPTTGLHGEDVKKLVGVLNRLVDSGNTVVVVEHNLDFIAVADWVVDLGPGGGEEGGKLVDAGTPSAVAGRALGPTGGYLSKHLGKTVGGQIGDRR